MPSAAYPSYPPAAHHLSIKRLMQSPRSYKNVGFILLAFFLILLLRPFGRGSQQAFSDKLRVDRPLAAIVVHSVPHLDPLGNFELKRAIANTYARDAEELGIGVFFATKHERSVLLRNQYEFVRSGAPKKHELAHKTLVPHKIDDAPGLLKIYHHIYNNTDWALGPMFSSYPYILHVDASHYVHVENLARTLLSAKKRILTINVDPEYRGTVTDAQECESYHQSLLTAQGQEAGSSTQQSTQDGHLHRPLTANHLISRKLFALVGPHLATCINQTIAGQGSRQHLMIDSEIAQFQQCIQEWASDPLIWKGAYCGRFSTRRFNELDQDDNGGDQRLQGEGADARRVQRGQDDDDDEDTDEDDNGRKRKGLLSGHSRKSRWVLMSGMRYGADFVEIHKSLRGKNDMLDHYH
ncbi:hypothetical protein DFQ26_006005 [Actinomortierella ambigua]|nr:hypothetical protein DFQ26_006005 [Actinomortierella ambigua]